MQAEASARPDRYAPFLRALQGQVRGEVLADDVSRMLYATDASIYQIEPIAVLVPENVEDVRRAVIEAARFDVPVLPRGGASSLAGQTVGRALVIDFTRHLDAILDVDVEARRTRVQPGVVLDTLNARLADHGLMVGPDPASSNRATIGGMLANNSTGSHSILYGNMIRHVRSARAILADGSEVDLGECDWSEWDRRSSEATLEGRIYLGLRNLIGRSEEIIRRDTASHWRRNNGYRVEELVDTDRPNLARLLCGSEGTLAIVTEIELDLVERPARSALAIVHFRTRQGALEAVPPILETRPAAVELFDGPSIRQFRQVPGFGKRLDFVDGDPGAVLITEYYLDDGESADAHLDRLHDSLESMATDAYAVKPVTRADLIDGVWAVRKAALGLIMSVKGDHKPIPFIEDAAVPVEHLAEYVSQLEEAILRLDADTRVAFYAHASAGCLHVRPFVNLKEQAEVDKMKAISLASMHLVRQYGGVVSSEHGDGLARSWLNAEVLGADLYDVCRRVKSVFDPENLLNPGKIVDAPPMTEHLRFGPDYSTSSIAEHMDFSGDGGFARAVEMCNGAGSCRKLSGGTMCPSFMATRQEGQSTRGRANALRAALSGALPEDSLTGPRLYEVMDLCIQCKACKTECPSGVDMAKIKTEWLATYWDNHRPSVRTRLFATMPATARRLSGRFAPAVNWTSRRSIVRRTMEWGLGVSRERTLPEFSRRSFVRWFRSKNWDSDGPEVVLFPDTFSNYSEPDVGQAAALVLKAAGYRVVVPEQPVCCGRTYLSKGFLDSAQESALRTVDVLYEYARRNVPVVGLEPSCILTLRDEFLALLPGDTRASAVAESAVLFEELVASDPGGRFASAPWRNGSQHAIVHGHCHQKALTGMGALMASLSVVPGLTGEALDSGCCGMAGAFGYEVEHVAISRQMAELSLAPAVRRADHDDLVVAPGTSCRAQIRDMTGRVALHPAQVLRDSLNPDGGSRS